MTCQVPKTKVVYVGLNISVCVYIKNYRYPCIL